MTDTRSRKNLAVLVADKQMEFTVRGLLDRSQSLQMRPVQYEVFQHPWRDSGCRLSSAAFLRPFVNSYERALVMFDKEGCGQENLKRSELENTLESELAASGWGDRAAVIVIDPELENWVWSDSPHVEAVLGWQGRLPNLRNWLQTQGYLNAGATKPSSPKEAMKAALRVACKAQSAALFLELAQKVSFERCNDPAFLKFKTTLPQWFPSK